ncbi:MAG: sensor signal transduction histidine kinase [Conexibacter sp.]|nr:sensor signal transduction histidine kinase [Conexibacter sp.]
MPVTDGNGCPGNTIPDRVGSVHDAQALAQELYAAFNARDDFACRELLDDRVTFRTTSRVFVGREATMAYAHEVLWSVADLVVEVERVVAATPTTAVCELRFESLERRVFCQIVEVREGRLVDVCTYRASEPGEPASTDALLSDGGVAHHGDERVVLRLLNVLAAEEAPPEEALRAVVEAVSAQFGGARATLVRSGQDGHEVTVVAAGPGSDVGDGLTVAAQIVVDSEPWGVLTAGWPGGRPSVRAETRLSRFAEIAAVAISRARARADLGRLVDEQSALRRVAELVAHGALESELFDAVAAEAAQLIDDEGTTLVRFDGPRTYTIVATCGGPAPVGLRVDVPDDDDGTSAEVLRTRRPARRDDYQIGSGPLFDREDYGVGSSVSVPILVDDRLWGMLGTLTERRRLPEGTERRLQQFAELVAAALANSQARAEVQRLADEEAALRRVAELVARGSDEAELFETVTIEAAGLVGNEATTLVRYEGERTFTILATHGGPVPPGTTVVVPPDDRGTFDQMLRHPDRPARLDDYGSEPGPLFTRDRYGVGSSVSVPILVDDRLWGMLGVLTEGTRLPTDTEERLQKFAALVAAALANSQARRQLATLADGQAALRRVAELVARSAPLDEVFDAVAKETSRLFGNLAAALTRFDTDGVGTVVAACNSAVPLNLKLAPDGDSVVARVFRTGQPVRVSTYSGTGVAELAKHFDVGAAVGVPVTVDGRIWATLTTSTSGAELPHDSESRLEEFAALAAAAIANAENKVALTASRARVVATADETRRRLQRDVHDGAQARLVQTVIGLQLARDAIARGGSGADHIDEALYHAERGSSELRDLVHGILPASLDQGGLRAGLESLIADLPMAVGLQFEADGLPTPTETTAYFVVAEALTNVVKHADATSTEVRVRINDDKLIIDISDNGRGGADPARGTGLMGLSDRVAAAEGTLAITSHRGTGTALRAELPVADRAPVIK